MGKNQAYKSMQRARLGSSSTAGPEEVDDGMTQVDGSFHSPEWHAARLASLKTSHTVTWEEFKKRRKEEEMRKGELEADKDKMMREYRAQLDAERSRKLAHGKNHSSSKSRRKKDKDRDSKKHGSKKRKHSRRSSDSSSSSLSETSSSDDDNDDDDDDDERESKRPKSRSRKKRNKGKKHRSKSKHSSSENEETDGPLPLSRFFGSLKN